MRETSDCSVAIKSNWKLYLIKFIILYVALYIPTAFVHELGHLATLTIIGVGGSIYYDPPFGLITIPSSYLTPPQSFLIGISGGVLAGLFDFAVLLLSDGVLSDVAFAHMVTQLIYSAYEGFSAYRYVDVGKCGFYIATILGLLLVLIKKQEKRKGGRVAKEQFFYFCYALTYLGDKMGVVDKVLNLCKKYRELKEKVKQLEEENEKLRKVNEELNKEVLELKKCLEQIEKVVDEAEKE